MECFVACFDLKRLFCYRRLNDLENGPEVVIHSLVLE